MTSPAELPADRNWSPNSSASGEPKGSRPLGARSSGTGAPAWGSASAPLPRFFSWRARRATSARSRRPRSTRSSRRAATRSLGAVPCRRRRRSDPAERRCVSSAASAAWIRRASTTTVPMAATPRCVAPSKWVLRRCSAKSPIRSSWAAAGRLSPPAGSGRPSLVRPCGLTISSAMRTSRSRGRSRTGCSSRRIHSPSSRR
jgi:hypothetical protein